MREEEKKGPSQDSNVKRFFKKRWVFPAIYIASAALILTAVLWYQNSSTDKATDKYDYNASDVPGEDFKEPAVEVNRAMENILLPIASKERDNAVVQKKFYDDSAAPEDQEAALVVYKNQYHPNTGIDITLNEGQAFEVVSALSGTVTKVQEDALLGNVIEIEHDENIVTRYQSVKDMAVNVGDQVKQGQAIATAGQSLFNEEAGVHVHFEIRKDGIPVNPESYLDKPLSALQEAEINDNARQASEEDPAMHEEGTEEGAATEEEAEGQDASTEKQEEGTTEEDSSTEKSEQGTSEGQEGSKDSTGSEKKSPESDESNTDDKADQKQNDETNTNETKNTDA
jgi:stage II sporulation protein Q